MVLYKKGPDVKYCLRTICLEYLSRRRLGAGERSRSARGDSSQPITKCPPLPSPPEARLPPQVARFPRFLKTEQWATSTQETTTPPPVRVPQRTLGLCVSSDTWHRGWNIISVPTSLFPFTLRPTIWSLDIKLVSLFREVWSILIWVPLTSAWHGQGDNSRKVPGFWFPASQKGGFALQLDGGCFHSSAPTLSLSCQLSSPSSPWILSQSSVEPFFIFASVHSWKNTQTLQTPLCYFSLLLC